MQLLPEDPDVVIHHRGRSFSEDKAAGHIITGIPGHLLGGAAAPGTVTIPGGRTARHIAGWRFAAPDAGEAMPPGPASFDTWP
ncbi:MAG: hypothetical protein OXF88_21520 [Rhodobacteraceae bacterium]|nr:hypothetical protein [Paracoccaceae bacterium]MCY4136636.1 hypothetical protein [Paracoccaceae bacterium]